MLKFIKGYIDKRQMKGFSTRMFNAALFKKVKRCDYLNIWIHYTVTDGHDFLGIKIIFTINTLLGKL